MNLDRNSDIVSKIGCESKDIVPVRITVVWIQNLLVSDSQREVIEQQSLS